MKSKIKFSRFVIGLTTIVVGVLFVGCIVNIHVKPAFFTLLAIYVLVIVCALVKGPAYIKCDNDSIVMGSILNSKRIPMRDVVSVDLFQPTMGAIRIFASGGFMGYWGIFRESDIGRYYAFYGKASDCFLVRMKNGDKYLLGCDNPGEMVAYIKSRLK